MRKAPPPPPPPPPPPNDANRHADDLAAIVFTVHGCAGARLREFDFSTHYISGAECAAIGNMTALTALRCASPHGFSAGGLAALKPLTALRRLELSDAPGLWTAADVAAVAGMTALTRLAVGGGTAMPRALLRRIADAAGCAPADAPADGGGGAGGGGGGGGAGGDAPQQWGGLPAWHQGWMVMPELDMLPPQEAAGPQPLDDAPPQPQPAAGGDGAGAGGGGNEQQPHAQQQPPPLALRELEVSFDWAHRANEDLLLTAARLTSLTSLTIGWLGRAAHTGGSARRAPLRGCAALAALSRLAALKELNAPWPVGEPSRALCCMWLQRNGVTKGKSLSLSVLPLPHQLTPPHDLLFPCSRP